MITFELFNLLDIHFHFNVNLKTSRQLNLTKFDRKNYIYKKLYLCIFKTKKD